MAIKKIIKLFVPILATASIVQAIPMVSAQSIDEIEVVVPGEFLVEMESSSAQNGLGSYLSSASVDASVNTLPNSTLSTIKVPLEQRGWVNFNEYLELIEKAPGVASVQPNYILSTTTGFSSNDALASKQWQLDSINAHKAWSVSADASQVTVAIIDDAVMIEHEDIRDNVWINTDEIPNNGVDDDRNGYIDDVKGWNFGRKNNNPSPVGPNCAHGTHVAGLAGAVGGNGKGVTGIAPKVKIMPLAIGRPKGCGLDSNGIIQAIYYAIDNGANIINMSLGGPVGDEQTKKALQAAVDKNILVIISAGNEGLSNDVEDLPGGAAMRFVLLLKGEKLIAKASAPSYPATFSRVIPGVLSIANLADKNNNLNLLTRSYSWTHELVNPRFSRRGKIEFDRVAPLPKGKFKIGSSYGARSVQIGTPGTDVLSTYPYDANGAISNQYKLLTGTSMAAPITAGAAAIIWANFPDMTNLQIKERLLKGATVNTQFANRIEGNRQLDLYQALCGDMFSRKAAGCTTAGVTPPPATPAPEPPAQVKPAPAKPAPAPTKPAPKPPEKKVPPKNHTDQLNDWLRS